MLIVETGNPASSTIAISKPPSMAGKFCSARISQACFKKSVLASSTLGISWEPEYIRVPFATVVK
jgi:hypothetical protein